MIFVLVEKELKELQTFGSCLYISKSYFNNDGAQLYLIFQPFYHTLKRLGDTEIFLSWKSRDLPAEKLTTTTTTDNSLSPSIRWYKNSNVYLIFKGSRLKQKSTTFTPPNIINFFVAYELDTWSRD